MTTSGLDRQKVAAARLWAVSRTPYLASALFASSVEPNRESGTIGVDRSWRVHADPAVVEAVTVEQLGRLLIHLVGHLVRDHAGRADRLRVAETNQREKWNRSADAELNDDLASDGLLADLAPDTPENLGCEAGKLAEAYFETGDDAPRRWDCGSGADGCERRGEQPGGLPDNQCDLLRLGVAAEIQQTAKREPGTVPAGWLRWAESVLPSKIDWRRVLGAEVRRAVAAVSGNVDFAYDRPSRRVDPASPILLPRLYRPLPRVAIVCDTSGSMHERLLARALAEIEGVLAKAGLRNSDVRVLAVDAAVHAVRRVTRAADVQLAGGGGTDMGTGIAAAAALRPKPSIIVVLTDGYTPWPDEPPRGTRVVVGLLSEGGFPSQWFPPAWARTVVIEDVPCSDPIAV